MPNPTSFAPLEIRRKLGRSNWATPVRHGPDGWSLVNLDGKPVLPDFTDGTGSI